MRTQFELRTKLHARLHCALTTVGCPESNQVPLKFSHGTERRKLVEIAREGVIDLETLRERTLMEIARL